MAVLSLVTGWTLVREVRMAHRESLALAMELAEAAANRVDLLLAGKGASAGREGGGSRRADDRRFRIGRSNELLYPRSLPWPPVPVPLGEPPGRVASAAWRAARSAPLDSASARAAFGAWDAFLKDPEAVQAHRWRGLARLERALALERSGESEAAVRAWQEVLDASSPAEVLALTESGVPVGHLAAWRLVEMVLESGSLDRLPTPWQRDPARPLRILGQVDSQYLRRVLAQVEPWMAQRVAESPELAGSWAAVTDELARHEQARRLHREAGRQYPDRKPWPPAFWIHPGPDRLLLSEKADGDAPSDACLAVQVPGVEPGREYRWFAPEDLAGVVGAVAAGFDRRGVYRLRLRIAGREHEVSGADASAAPEFGTVSDSTALRSEGELVSLRRSTAAGAEYRVLCALSDPGTERRLRERRAWWFAALLLASMGLAVVAVQATHRSLMRQFELSQQQSNFVSSVSHELRAPLASIRLLAESLERGTVVEPERCREYHGLIVRESRRLGALVENVLDFSRIRQGRKDFDFEPTDLRALVQGTVRLIEPLAAERGVSVVLKLPPEVAPHEARADGRAMQQALLNLLDNGLKHSPAGAELSVELRLEGGGVRTTGAVAPAEFLILVSDRGPGIPLAEQTRIFEPFLRLGSELRRETQGVGIGLSIVKHILVAHGGRVEVDSAPGRGATFGLRLPCDS